MELGNAQTDKILALAQQQRTVQAVTQKASRLDAATLQKIDAAAKDFEAVFLTEMLRPMFEEINKPDPIFGGGKGEEVFSKMMIDEYGKKMVANGGIGLAHYVREEMIRLQEAAHGAR